MKALYSIGAMAAIAIIALTGLPSSASADQMLDSYIARLSRADHYNSSGAPITTVAGIVRQDRANFHKFGLRDAEDQYDSVFSAATNRNLLEAKLEHGRCSASARRTILFGAPLILVKIYRSHIDVTVLN